MIRAVFTRLHRWVGLTVAGFLAIAGLTGSLIVFYQELDRALNPELFDVPVMAQRLSPSALASRVEAQLPGAHVTLLSIPAPGRASEVWVTGKSLPYDQVFADPATGKVLGQRKWGAAGLARANLMPMIYLFHYTLKLPSVWGVVLMGVIASLWSIDCFVAVVLTLPRGAPFWTKWGPAWRLKRGASAYRLQFDLHRAGGLWLWAVLFILATSSVALNLPEQVFRPLLNTFTTLSPTYEDLRPPAIVRAPRLSFDDALRLARREADRPQWVFREPGYIGVSYGAHGDKGLDGFGLSSLVFDDQTGARVLHQQAGQGRLADIYANMQYQLHSGRILGWPGRILVCLAGLAVTMLSVTGIVIWLRKRRARIVTQRRQAIMARSVAS